jgi:hypothetical protein
MGAHPRIRDPEAMGERAPSARYEFRIRRLLSQRLVGAFPDLNATAQGADRTRPGRSAQSSRYQASA